LRKFINNIIGKITLRKAVAVVLGNIICGLGIAVLRFSLMGNDPYTASTLAISDGLHVGLGNYQLALNIVLLIVQLIWGKKHLGFGTIVNMCFLGYIVQFFSFVIECICNPLGGKSAIIKLLVMLLSFIILTYGLSMYQVADLGVSPYDYLSLGMTDKWQKPYFLNRVITDIVCVLIIVLAVFGGLIGWENSHLGIGTVLAAFCLGPFINFFNKYNEKWIR